MPVAIPKKLGHIWVGHRPAPVDWLQTWREHHPHWTYRLYDNAYLTSRRWRNQALINAFFRRGEYAGVSDLMRYEILQDEGGFIPEADSICLRNTDDLWNAPALYSVWEQEEKRPGLISPFLASAPGHPYLNRILIRIKRRNDPNTLRPAWRSVGNRFLKLAMAAIPAENVTIFPSHYFIPTHKLSGRYQGPGPVYCEQLWGSTLGRYQEPGLNVDVDAMRQGILGRLDDHLKTKTRAAA